MGHTVEIRDSDLLEILKRKSEPYLSRIDTSIKKEMELYRHSKLYGPILYALEGGKRVRPTILMVAAESVGSDIGDTDLAAVAVELLHTESIIHDDVIDEAASRREKVAFHIKYGYGAAMLTADYVFGMILDIASKYSDSRVSRELSVASLRMCEGEYLELRVDPKSYSMNWDEYVEIISKKTASLFQTAARLGSIIGGGSEEEIEALSSYGLNLGIAFQIQDDVLDWGSEGKIAEALARKRSPEAVLERMKEMAESYSIKAKESLNAVKSGPAKDLLVLLADFTIIRDY
ncbi:MAG: polyprenyl synthetase family protein [Thaumarchaeota archaeon]|nr:polyprenyl synthetase family protein [Nitrososphaerota archaeon]